MITTREEYWRSKSNPELSEAATHLAECNKEDAEIIVAELRCRDNATQRPTGAAHSQQSLSASAAVVGRYRDAYRVGAALVAFGNIIKIGGAVLAGIIFLGSASAANVPFGGGGIVAGGVLLALVVGIFFWICGVIVAAQGQILRATLDNAVAHSPFLNDYERLDAMGLPRSLADSAGA